MTRLLLLGTVFVGIGSGLAFNAIYLLLGRPWPTGWVLALHCMIWPVGGAIWGWRMYRWKRSPERAATSSLTDLGPLVAILSLAVVAFAVFGRGERSGLERRIEASLPGAPTVGPGETDLRDRVRIVATLTRVQGEPRLADVTEVEIGGERRSLGPAGRDVDGRPDGADLWIRDTVARMKATQHRTVGELRVAQGVPREDVRRVADGFLVAGISDVTFAGPPPAAGMK